MCVLLDLQVVKAIRVTTRIVYEELERSLRRLHLQQRHKATAHIAILKTIIATL